MTALHPDVSGIAVDVRLFHEAWCYLVHKYRVYKDPLTHPALGGGGEYLLGCCRSWAGLWPLRSSHICTFPFLHRGRPAIQLHRDVCLMATNLDILDQYALSMKGTASKMLQLGLDSRGFPLAEVAVGALGPRVRRASVQMEAMRLWRPSLDPVMMP